MQQEPKEFSVIVEALKSPWTYIMFIIFASWAGLAHVNLTGFALAFAFLLSLHIKIDIKHMILPDSLNILLLIVGLIAHTTLYGSFTFSLLGALFGFCLFFFIFYITYKIKGEPSMGFGDVKFITALGAWVGLIGVPLILIWASLLAGIFVIVKSIFKGAFINKPFAYGPFLAVAGWLSFLYPHQTWNVILKLREQILGVF